MRRFIKLIKEKWLKQTSLTILLVVLILFVFVAVNVFVQAMDLNPIDFTKEKIYSLSDESKEQIKDIEQNVNIYFFGYSESATSVVLGKQYEDVNDKIHVEVVSTSERPDLAADYGVSSDSQLVAVASSQRYKAIDASEMYSYDQTSGTTVDITEQKLTNAIIDVTIASKPQVYFLTGHGEYGISSTSSSTGSAMYYLAQYIVNEVNDVSTLDLLTDEMPEECDVLIIANPTTDFQDVETERIQNYINNGGKIFWMQDPYVNISGYDRNNYPNINKILDQFGISFSKGVVCEQSSSNMVYSYPDLIIPELTYNSIVKDIYTDGKVVMCDTGRINNVSDDEMESLNVTASAFIKSTETSFYKETISESASYLMKEDGDEEGAFILGETLTKKIDDEHTATLVAYANAFFATNYAVALGSSYTYPIALRNNKDLLLNTVAYLTNREDSIRIRKDTGLVAFTTATGTQDTIVRWVIFGVPALIILAGIIISIRRRVKK